MTWILRFSGFFLLLITLLPLFPTGKWYVRWWDFPRLQIAILLAIPLLVASVQIFNSGLHWEKIAWACAVLAGIIWQISHVIEFSPVWPTEVATNSDGSPKIKLMVSNLDYENFAPDNVSGELDDEDADILLLIEVNKAWSERLQQLRAKYYHYEELRGEGLGMAVWSKIPIQSAETKHLISDRRASLWVRLKIESDKIVNLVGVHPTPPGLSDSTGDTRRDSRVRDAELILIAKEIAARSDEAWIVAGDFNDVAWSHTTRLFKRTSGLLDPRIGRGMYNTYMAQYPPFRCPIDHVFLSEGFTVGTLARKRVTGSDHFAVLTTLSLAALKGVTPQTQGNDKIDAETIIEEGKADADERDVRG
ncbi:MAG: endonuclease/exonuclease/phosphatase family protein [Mariniblastus sp.]